MGGLRWEGVEFYDIYVDQYVSKDRLVVLVVCGESIHLVCYLGMWTGG